MRLARTVTSLVTLLGVMSSPAAGDQLAYITDAYSGVLYVVDLAINRVVLAAPVGTPIFLPVVFDYPVLTDLAIAPGGEIIYLTGGGHNTVFVVDTTTHTVTDEIHVGAVPMAITLTPDGRYAYVTNFCGREPLPPPSCGGSGTPCRSSTRTREPSWLPSPSATVP